MRELHKLTLVALLVFVPVGVASAFHGGGVAHCDGCHSMHNSADNPISGTANSLLLKGSDPSSTCLNCHNGSGSYHINSTDGSNVTQGGDYFWMTLTYNVVIRGNTTAFEADNHGHNIVAADYGFLADQNPNNSTAPGGTFPAASLFCTSCHDAHGQVNGGTGNMQPPISASGSYGSAEPTDGTVLGNYRILGSSTYQPLDEFGDPVGSAFSAASPIAASSGFGPPGFGASVDYGSGMAEWCANCHPDYINDSQKHPSGNGEHLNGEASNYNSYVATGDFTGVIATAFDGLVPFERGVTTGGWDLNPTSTVGADSASNVMCLTCHRAHASANANAGKWDFEVEFLAHSHALESPDVPVGAAVYYDDGVVIDVATKYGQFQRSLCNKCHVQD
jgi:hypothetical protein